MEEENKLAPFTQLNIKKRNLYDASVQECRMKQNNYLTGNWIHWVLECSNSHAPSFQLLNNFMFFTQKHVNSGNETFHLDFTMLDKFAFTSLLVFLSRFNFLCCDSNSRNINT